MKTTCITLSVAALLVLAIPAKGQVWKPYLAHTEFGAFAGTLNYSGDVATTLKPAAMLKEVRPNFGIHVKRFFNNYVGVGIEASHGRIYAHDENHTNGWRGYEVDVNISQVNAVGEFHFKRFGKYHSHNNFAWYGRAGFGLSVSNARLIDQPQLAFKTYQVEPKTLVAANFFAGLGMKYRIGQHAYLFFNIDLHYLNSDELEGWQFIYNESDNDVYGGARIGFSYMIF